MNWTLILIALNYFFGWQAGFYQFASCLVFAVFLFSHIPFRTRAAMAILPIVGTIIVVNVTSLLPPLYVLPDFLIVEVNLANTTLSIVLNLAILVYFVRRVQEQQEQLSEEVQVRERLIADLSHEMKTPIAAMLTRTQVELIVEPLPEKTEEAFEMIQRNLRGMKRLVNRMLDLTGLELGRRTVQAALFDPDQIVHECLELHQPLADEKQVTFECSNSTSGNWQSDPELLRIVLNNLLSNAIRYSPSGGTVYVTCREINQENGLRRCITVRDEGPGIPAEHLSSIFEPFFRGSLDRPRQENAYGLGLSIAQRVMNLLDGRIDVVSEPGRGSEFSIQL